jgi:hypothetical protein
MKATKEAGRPCLAAGAPPAHRQPGASPSSDASSVEPSRQWRLGATAPPAGLSALLDALVLTEYLAVDSPYTAAIQAVLDGYPARAGDVDPALVEAYMRLSHRTLDALSTEQFAREVAASSMMVHICPLGDSIDLARSKGLVL